MDIVEILSFIAGVMTMGAPAIQAVKTLRTRDVAGLSTSTYLLLMGVGMFSVLIGVEYRIVAMTTLNALTWLFNIAILWLVSRRAFLAFFGGLAVLYVGTWLLAPQVLEDLLTTRWADQVAFIYGVIAGATFLPQVILTHRTRATSALSLWNLVIFVTAMAVWIVVSAMLGNWSLIFWNAVLLLMVAELLRLKITIEGIGRRAKPELAGS